MCEHLSELENELKARNIKETYRGQPWSDNCLEWVYFDGVLNLEKLRERLQLPAHVVDYRNDDQRSGAEMGFVCELCKDAIMGVHPEFASGKISIE